MADKKILEFYKKTSLYTDLGLYKEFAKGLPNDIEQLCLFKEIKLYILLIYLMKL